MMVDELNHGFNYARARVHQGCRRQAIGDHLHTLRIRPDEEMAQPSKWAQYKNPMAFFLTGARAAYRQQQVLMLHIGGVISD